ncbi:acyl-CoA dehydrogenase family protein [Pedobacter montanisoli]|uniref:Acyl-CoA dehydrogenase n=1 Tax=Pedobacter montanisoli TaxID=2923277 RepID=A0ABS9ZVU3_9SPHI|nr:acyl-CoA dehydrogenase [Pedobacter montanisoli]MCJ0742417.1 acyl-CoA dehydrogenase [Pedobacter montanisoli]
MKNILTEAHRELIRSLSAESEKLGQLHPLILDMAYQHNWFKLFVPEIYGGPGMKLPDILRLEEELAYLDGSLAWTITLCSGASWFTGFIDSSLVKAILADDQACFAGSGATGGTARKSANGYIINGRWQYASGALHATVFTANCILQDEKGNAIQDGEGNPLIKSFVFKKSEVQVLPGWSYIGMIATGSHSFEVNELEVPENRSFVINTHIQVTDRGFDYPFLQLAETTLSVNSLGMARHFTDLVEQHFFTRAAAKRYEPQQVSVFTTELKKNKNELDAARNQFYQAFDDSWQQLNRKGTIDEHALLKVSKLSRELAHQTRTSVDRLYPYAGLEAAKKETEINRVWRDLHTASQHALLTFAI